MADSAGSADSIDVLTCDIAISLLHCSQPWELSEVFFHPLWDAFMLRPYDLTSDSQPDDQHRLLAAHPKMRLVTEDTCHKTLTSLADRKEWEETPYISFPPDDLQDLVELQMARKRAEQFIASVDGHRKDVMAFYGIYSRYGPDHSNSDYVCLWEVTPKELVGIWDWKSSPDNGGWFREVILPAAEAHRKQRQHDQLHGTVPPEVDMDGGDNTDQSVAGGDPDASKNTCDDDTDIQHLNKSADSDERLSQEAKIWQLKRMLEDLGI